MQIFNSLHCRTRTGSKLTSDWLMMLTNQSRFESPFKDQTISSSTLEHDFNRANGQFKFDFDFFETSNFREIQQDPTFMVGQQINFGSKYRHRCW